MIIVDYKGEQDILEFLSQPLKNIAHKQKQLSYQRNSFYVL